MANYLARVETTKPSYGRHFVLIAILILTETAQAQPPRGTILGDINVAGKVPCQSVQIGLNFPLRYLSHIPLKDGKELLIKIKPVITGPQETASLSSRESYTLVDATSSLHDIVYEGDVEDGPFLALHFTQQVKFKVAQGSDYRSVRVVFHGPGPSSCGDVMDAP